MSRLPPSGTTSDRDSLAALDALLKLNAASQDHLHILDQSRARANLSHSLQHSLVNGLAPGYSSAASALASRLVSAQGLLGPPPSSATLALHRAVEMLSWPTTGVADASTVHGRHQFPPSQLATAQAAVGIQHRHDQLLASHKLSQKLQEAVEHGQRSAAAAFAAGASSNLGSAAVVCTSSTDSLLCQREDQSAATSSDFSSNDAPSRATVRAEKVEAALRSKPQRGKKRDDLSDKEREELTRTRNREHAKSTRYVSHIALGASVGVWIFRHTSPQCDRLYCFFSHRVRKKARYQALLDNEKKLAKIKEGEKLKAERLMRLQQFVAFREAMLDRDLSNPSANVTTKAMDTSRLLSIVGQEGYFQYGVQDLKNTDLDAEQQSSRSHGIEEAVSRMSRWDQRVRERVLALHTQEQKYRQQDPESGAVPLSLTYEITGGVDGIAISNDGNGYVRAELICKTESSIAPSSLPSQVTKQGRTLLAGMLVVQFVGCSSQFAATAWTTIHDFLPFAPSSVSNESESPDSLAVDAPASKNDDEPPSLSNETLGYQLIHPSVVSLENGKGVFDGEESNGPGMEIS